MNGNNISGESPLNGDDAEIIDAEIVDAANGSEFAQQTQARPTQSISGQAGQGMPEAQPKGKMPLSNNVLIGVIAAVSLAVVVALAVMFFGRDDSAPAPLVPTTSMSSTSAATQSQISTSVVAPPVTSATGSLGQVTYELLGSGGGKYVTYQGETTIVDGGEIILPWSKTVNAVGTPRITFNVAVGTVTCRILRGAEILAEKTQVGTGPLECKAVD